MGLGTRYVLACVLVVLHAGSLAAQDRDGTADSDTLRWSITPYVGAQWLDDELADVGMEVDSPVALFGARIGYRFRPGWSFEASYGYASLSATADSAAVAGTAPLQEVDGALHVYDAVLVYDFPREARARARVSAGAGGMRYSYDPFTRRNAEDERVQLVDTSWAHELALLFGAGLEVDAGDRAAIRFDVRERLQFCSAEASPINETEDFSHCPLDDTVLGNLELSGGVTIRF